MNGKLYHVRPKVFLGEALMPLNQFKTFNPTQYERMAAKYKGREVLMQVLIPLLNCLWNDVVFLSPVHPEKIKQQLEELGLEWRIENWLELNPVLLPDFEEKAVIYRLSSSERQADFAINPTDVVPFEHPLLAECDSLPDMTLNYYKNCVENKRRMLLFHGIAHVLYRGEINFDLFKHIKV